MNLLELKGGILEYVVRVQNKEQLQQIYDQLYSFVEESKVKEYIPPHVEAELDAAIAEMDNEELWISHEEAMNQIKAIR